MLLVGATRKTVNLSDGGPQIFCKDQFSGESKVIS